MIWVNLMFSLTQGYLDEPLVFQALFLKAFCSPLKKKMKKNKNNQTTKQPLPLPKKNNQTHKPTTTTTTTTEKTFVILKKRDLGMRVELFDRVSYHYYS